MISAVSVGWSNKEILVLDLGSLVFGLLLLRAAEVAALPPKRAVRLALPARAIFFQREAQPRVNNMKKFG